MANLNTALVALRIAKAAGPYIGPKGGLWADPQHTQHWDNAIHGPKPDAPAAEHEAHRHVMAQAESDAEEAAVAAELQKRMHWDDFDMPSYWGKPEHRAQMEAKVRADRAKERSRTKVNLTSEDTVKRFIQAARDREAARKEHAMRSRSATLGTARSGQERDRTERAFNDVHDGYAYQQHGLSGSDNRIAREFGLIFRPNVKTMAPTFTVRDVSGLPTFGAQNDAEMHVNKKYEYVKRLWDGGASAKDILAKFKSGEAQRDIDAAFQVDKAKAVEASEAETNRSLEHARQRMAAEVAQAAEDEKYRIMAAKRRAEQHTKAMEANPTELREDVSKQLQDLRSTWKFDTDNYDAQGVAEWARQAGYDVHEHPSNQQGVKRTWGSATDGTHRYSWEGGSSEFAGPDIDSPLRRRFEHLLNERDRYLAKQQAIRDEADRPRREQYAREAKEAKARADALRSRQEEAVRTAPTPETSNDVGERIAAFLRLDPNFKPGVAPFRKTSVRVAWMGNNFITIDKDGRRDYQEAGFNAAELKERVDTYLASIGMGEAFEGAKAPKPKSMKASPAQEAKIQAATAHAQRLSDLVAKHGGPHSEVVRPLLDPKHSHVHVVFKNEDNTDAGYVAVDHKGEIITSAMAPDGTYIKENGNFKHTYYHSLPPQHEGPVADASSQFEQEIYRQAKAKSEERRSGREATKGAVRFAADAGYQPGRHGGPMLPSGVLERHGLQPGGEAHDLALKHGIGYSEAPASSQFAPKLYVTGNTFPHRDKIKASVPRGTNPWREGSKAWEMAPDELATALKVIDGMKKGNGSPLSVAFATFFPGAFDEPEPIDDGFAPLCEPMSNNDYWRQARGCEKPCEPMSNNEAWHQSPQPDLAARAIDLANGGQSDVLGIHQDEDGDWWFPISEWLGSMLMSMSLAKAKYIKKHPTGRYFHRMPGSAPMAKAEKPPKGFIPIPDSKHGGYHKRVGNTYQTWYPDGSGAHKQVQEEVHERHAAEQPDKHEKHVAADDHAPAANADEQGAQLTADLPKLPENHSAYFLDHPEAEMIPLDKLRPVRARPKGVKNAHGFMAAAADGTMAKRGPISVEKNPDGTYTVLDGNSTFANAKHSDWKTIPVVVQNGQVTLNRLEAVAAKYGGATHTGTFTLGDLQAPVMVPNEPEKVMEAWTKLREKLAAKIGDVPKGASEKESRAWKNDHRTDAKGLSELAEATKPAWIEAVRGVAEAAGGKAAMGPGDKFATKAPDKIAEKVQRKVKDKGITEKEAVDEIGDALRATVVVPSTKELGSALRAAGERFKSLGADFTVDNKWVGEPNSTGYCAIHCDVSFPSANGEMMKAELQFHVSSIFDGTMDNPKEQGHLLFERYRTTDKNVEPGTKEGLRMAQVLHYMTAMGRMG